MKKKCKQLITLKDFGNFHKVIVEKGKSVCTCQLYMKWKNMLQSKEVWFNN